MIHRNLTVDNDWTFGKGLQNFTSGRDAILLNVKTRLQSWRGDCFYAETEGVDYNNFLDRNTKSLLDSDIKRVILRSEGIIKIVSYESELNESDRSVSINTVLLTIYGNVRISEVL